MSVVWWSIAAVVLALIGLGLISDALARRRRRSLGLAAATDGPTRPENAGPLGHADQALDGSPALREEAHRPRPFPWSAGSP